MKKRRLLATAIAVIVAVILASAVLAALDPGTKAPDFTAPTADGKKFTLSDSFKKNPKVVVLDIWATWCPPCRAEIPYLVKMHKDYAKKGVAVVGLSVDADQEKLKTFIKDNKIEYAVPMDPNGEKYARNYKIQGIPTTYIIDRKGVIRFVHTGFSGKADAEKMEKEVKQLLAEKQST